MFAGKVERNKMYDVCGTTLMERHEQSSSQFGTFREENACIMITMRMRKSILPSISFETLGSCVVTLAESGFTQFS